MRVGARAERVMLSPVRWLVVRANPVGNRNVFCLGIEGGGARVMRPAPRSQSSMCIRRDSLILSQTRGENESPKLSVAKTCAHGGDL